MDRTTRSSHNVKPDLSFFKKTLRIISGLVSHAGKPLFHLIVFIISSTIYIIKITGYINFVTTFNFKKISRILGLKNQKRSGVIFSASKHNAKKKFKKLLFSKIKSFFWNAQVFFIVLEKLSFRFYQFLKQKLNPKIAVLLFILKIRLYFLRVGKYFSLLVTLKISGIKILGLTTLTFVVVSNVSSFLFWKFILKELPSPENLTQRELEVSTKIYDRNGVLLYKIFDEKNRSVVTFENIPQEVRAATIAVEDSEFYTHPGFSLKGIVRAILKNIKSGELTGGSTITQQLVKNALLSSEKTIVRKIKEITLAIKVELRFSKDEILEMYLNEVSYGGTAYGIQEAARVYFDKDVEKLSLSQAALLAGLPKSPSLFSPFGGSPEKAIDRKNEVLNLMYEKGFISLGQKEEAKKDELKFAKNKIDILAPHFVMFVEKALTEKYGKEIVEKGGLEVVTTLDYQIQKLSEVFVKEELEKLTKLNVNNASVVVLEVSTGEILAMVGSKDYFDTENQGNVNVAISERQPGSSIKVINYAYALENGHNPLSIIPDSAVTFLIPNQPPYTPKNYEGGFKGNMTLRSALAESRNIPAVRILNSYGVNNMIEMGKKMGITTWNDPSQYGLSLTLGGGEVKLLDLARVYATIANYGKRPELTSILKITNYKGKILENNTCVDDEKPVIIAEVSASESSQMNKFVTKEVCRQNRALDERVAFILTDILRDNKARSPAFGTNSQLVIPNHNEVAVKTGTSNNLRDNWTIGYNQKYVVAVWVGNNDGSEMARIASGVTGASPIFNKIMSALLTEQINLTKDWSDSWEIPDGLVQLPICPLTGTLACVGCPVKMEWFLEENKPQVACNPEWFKKDEEKVEADNETNSESQEETLQNENPNPYWETEIIDLRQKIEKRKRVRERY